MSSEVFLYLETRGAKTGSTRRIEIWFVEHASRYYLVAELRGDAHWVRNLQADPRVAFSVGTRGSPEVQRAKTRALARVLDEHSDAGTLGAVRALMDAKYGWSEGWVVELEPTDAVGSDKTCA